jgi:uncharacterized iron-regulated membrane protein
MEPSPGTRIATRKAQRRALLWRIHFWAALIASPFALAAALTGILYVFAPQIESALYEKLDKVAPAVSTRPLDDSVQAARAAAPPGWTLHSVIPQQTVADSVQVVFVPPAKPEAPKRMEHEHTADKGAKAEPKTSGFLRGMFGPPKNAVVIYVDPRTATILGSLPNADRFNYWARKLHSTYLVDGWRWVIELAASWVMVMLVTGIFLWWPREGQAGVPQASASGRVAWKQWHAFIGVCLSAISASILVTGLTWSKNAGEQIRWARDAVGQTPPRIPAHFKSAAPEGAKPLSWDAAVQAIRKAAPDVQMQVVPPRGPDGYWRANQVDRGSPTKCFDLLLDAYTGKTLYHSGWDEQTAFGKATAIGIPFHRGEFGVWNQLVLLAFGTGIVFSLVTGWVMYFKRRRMGLGGFPPLVPGAWKSVSPFAAAGGAFMFVVMPLLALSAACVALVEVLLYLKSRRIVQP